jgi:hypothetical protein
MIGERGRRRANLGRGLADTRGLVSLAVSLYTTDMQAEHIVTDNFAIVVVGREVALEEPAALTPEPCMLLAEP